MVELILKHRLKKIICLFNLFVGWLVGRTSKYISFKPFWNQKTKQITMGVSSRQLAQERFTTEGRL